MKNFFILLLGLFVAAFIVRMFIAQAIAYDGGNYISLPQKIAERFNLNFDEVQSFFNEIHQKRIQQAQERVEIKLNEALLNGKITQAQKEAILVKIKELYQKKEDLNCLSFKERRSRRQELQKEMKDWADQNGIDFGFLRKFQGFFWGKFSPRGFCSNL